MATITRPSAKKKKNGARDLALISVTKRILAIRAGKTKELTSSDITGSSGRVFKGFR